jgi:aminotransferase
MIAARARTFTESVIREMTRVAAQYGAVNLSQGFPDFPMPAELKAAACDAINADDNQYAITWGQKPLRDAIVAKYRDWYGFEVDPEKHVTVTCGATEAMAAVCLALLDPGDEVIVFEPFYENYGPDAILCGASPKFIPLEKPDWRLDPDRLRAAFTKNTKAIIVNTPQNPSGKVLSREEMQLIADLCIEHDAWAITDEIYEHIIYEGTHHLLAGFPGMRERTVTISGLSKTFSCTGWRLGYAIAPAEQSVAIRKVHDFLTVGAPAPLQAAGAVGMRFGRDYYGHMSDEYRERRDLLLPVLAQAGFTFHVPEGAYYVLADFSKLSKDDDTTFAKWMAREIGVATVPGSSFYHPGSPDGKQLVRFAFCKTRATLEAAAERLRKLSS